MFLTNNLEQGYEILVDDYIQYDFLPTRELSETDIELIFASGFFSSLFRFFKSVGKRFLPIFRKRILPIIYKPISQFGRVLLSEKIVNPILKKQAVKYYDKGSDILLKKISGSKKYNQDKEYFRNLIKDENLIKNRKKYKRRTKLKFK